MWPFCRPKGRFLSKSVGFLCFSKKSELTLTSLINGNVLGNSKTHLRSVYLVKLVSWFLSKGLFTNYVDKCLDLFIHLPTPLTFSTLKMLTKSQHFWTTYPPPLVNIVCERPLIWFLAESMLIFDFDVRFRESKILVNDHSSFRNKILYCLG